MNNPKDGHRYFYSYNHRLAAEKLLQRAGAVWDVVHSLHTGCYDRNPRVRRALNNAYGQQRVAAIVGCYSAGCYDNFLRDLQWRGR